MAKKYISPQSLSPLSSVLDPMQYRFMLDLVNKINGIDVGNHSDLNNLDVDDHVQYHNDTRALSWLHTRTTLDLAESGNNRYYTSQREQEMQIFAIMVS